MRSVAWSIAYAGIATFLLNAFSGVVGESPIWLPAGIGLGVLLVFGLHYWPLVFIGATLGEMGGGHQNGNTDTRGYRTGARTYSGNGRPVSKIL